MRALWGCEPCEGWIERYGIPKALYVDFKNVYITTREPTLGHISVQRTSQDQGYGKVKCK